MKALSQVRKIIYYLDATNLVNAQAGDKNWDVLLQPPLLFVKVNLSSYNIGFYQVNAKLVHAINNPEVSYGDLDAARRLIEEQEAQRAEQIRLEKLQYEEERRQRIEFEDKIAREKEMQREIMETRKREEEERIRRILMEQEQIRELERLQREQADAERANEEVKKAQNVLFMTQKSVDPVPIAALPVNDFSTPPPHPFIIPSTPTPAPIIETMTIPHASVPFAQSMSVPEVTPHVLENPLLLEVKKKIAKECDDYTKKVAPIVVVVDWNAILSHPKFVVKSEYDKKRLIDPLSTICANILNRNYRSVRVT